MNTPTNAGRPARGGLFALVGVTASNGARLNIIHFENGY